MPCQEGVPQESLVSPHDKDVDAKKQCTILEVEGLHGNNIVIPREKTPPPLTDIKAITHDALNMKSDELQSGTLLSDQNKRATTNREAWGQSNFKEKSSECKSHFRFSLRLPGSSRSSSRNSELRLSESKLQF